MKYIISIFFLSAFSIMSFDIAEPTDFYSFFKNAYAQSFEGLGHLKNERGESASLQNVVGFEQCKVQYNRERSVNEMVLISTHDTEASSKTLMAELETQLSTMLPEWQYKKTLIKNQDGTQMYAFTYRSEKAEERNQYPSVDLDVVKKENGTFELAVRLYEPKQLRK